MKMQTIFKTSLLHVLYCMYSVTPLGQVPAVGLQEQLSSPPAAQPLLEPTQHPCLHYQP